MNQRVGTFLSALARASAVGLLLGLLLYGTGVIPNLKVSLVINLLFPVVMWPGFGLAAGWFAPRTEPGAHPGRSALVVLLKVGLVFTGLLGIVVVLVRVLTGINFLLYWYIALPMFFGGLLVANVVLGFRITSSLVESERSRARAEIDRLRLEHLEAEDARKSAELTEARQLQISMLPERAPDGHGLEVAFGMRTATEVGGDYYDCRQMADGSLALAIGDATGHGVRAGLVVVAAKTLFQTAEAGHPPREQLRRASAAIRGLNLRRMNMALALLSVKDGEVVLGSAGMPPALHYRAAGGDVVEISLPGPPAGQMRSFDYRDAGLRLGKGDRLLLLTDGLPECLSPGGDPLGYERLPELFRRVAPLPAADIVEALFREAEAWACGRPFEDDLSLVVLAS